MAQTQIRAYVDDGLLAEASARTTLAATLNGSVATLQQEMTLRIDENASIAAQITSLGTTMGDFNANLAQNYYTKAAADTAISAATLALKSSMEAPEGSIGGLTATLTSDYYTKTQADMAMSAATMALESGLTAPEGAIGGLAANLAENYYTRTQTEELTAEAAYERSLIATGPIYRGMAADDMTRLMLALSEFVGEQNAATELATAVQQTRAFVQEGVEATSTNLQLLSARLSGAETAIRTEEVARATADTAMAAQMTSLLADVDDVSANLSVNYYTKSGADAAIAAATMALESSLTAPEGAIGSLTATLSADYYTKTAADLAISAATMALESSLTGPEGAIGGLAATLSSDYYTKTDADAAISAASTTLKSTMEGAGGSVKQAQDAAQAASDLAGGKGKVFFQSAAPAASERLAQNLWIDTTGGANTPKRWNGSAWAAVTDKVATDAAAAAAAANTAVGNVTADLEQNYYTKTAANEAIAASQLELRSVLTATAPKSDFLAGAADWTSSASAAPDVAAALDPAWSVADGKASVAIGAANTPALRTRGVLPVREGETIRITVRVRAIGGSGGNNGLRIQWTWIPAGSWTALSSQSNDLSVAPGAAWSVHTIDRAAPAGAGYVRPGLLFRGAQYAGAPVAEVDIISVASVGAAAEVAATLTSDYYTKVDTDGAIAAKVDELNSALRNPNGQIKAGILTNYYTTAATDEAISTRIETFEAEYFTPETGQVKAAALSAYMTSASTNDAISASANALTASIDNVADTIQGFQRTLDTLATLTAGEAVTLSLGGSALGQVGTIIVAEGSAPRVLTGYTNGAYVQIPMARAVLFAGQRIKVGVLAKRPSSNPATRFGVCYSTNDNGNSGYVASNQNLTTAWAWHVFHLTIPPSISGGPGYLGIFGDHDKAGRAVQIARVFIEIASVAGELPEISSLSGQISDVRGLDMSKLNGTALGVLLTQLDVDAGGSSAKITSQGTAIATLQDGASAGYLIKAQAGGAVSLLDLIAADGSNGTASVAKLKADDILLDGSVAAKQLVITDFDGSSIPNGRFLYGDLRGWEAVPATFSVAAREGANDPAGQSAPTAHFLRIGSTGSTRTATMATGVAAREGDRFHARFSYAMQGATPRSATLRLLFSWFGPDGEALGQNVIGVANASATSWATFAEDISVPANAATVDIGLRRGGGGSGNAFVTNIEVVRQRDGRTFLTPNSITTNLIDTIDFNASGLAVFGGELRSANYSAGRYGDGWRIDSSGNAEFGTLALREGAVSNTTASFAPDDVQIVDDFTTLISVTTETDGKPVSTLLTMGINDGACDIEVVRNGIVQRTFRASSNIWQLTTGATGYVTGGNNVNVDVYTQYMYEEQIVTFGLIVQAGAASMMTIEVRAKRVAPYSPRVKNVFMQTTEMKR
ncbi:hypothetical protein [Gemmobacter megaterium]|uniref:hypothetical protein n=1 Tax=Gemmobacter megaterium TaxID=1086013 RepID=UPI001181798C|nr:hypothetical protein [Gemmobacter megaterium]